MIISLIGYILFSLVVGRFVGEWAYKKHWSIDKDKATEIALCFAVMWPVFVPFMAVYHGMKFFIFGREEKDASSN